MSTSELKSMIVEVVQSALESERSHRETKRSLRDKSADKPKKKPFANAESSVSDSDMYDEDAEDIGSKADSYISRVVNNQKKIVTKEDLRLNAPSFLRILTEGSASPKVKLRIARSLLQGEAGRLAAVAAFDGHPDPLRGASKAVCQAHLDGLIKRVEKLLIPSAVKSLQDISKHATNGSTESSIVESYAVLSEIISRLFQKRRKVKVLTEDDSDAICFATELVMFKCMNQEAVSFHLPVTDRVDELILEETFVKIAQVVAENAKGKKPVKV